MPKRWSAVFLLLVCLPGCATVGNRVSAAVPPTVPPEWNTVPDGELDAIWERARATGGMIAIEPATHVSGTQAAWKKTWEAADSFLKIYWGDEPIWFPSDVIRRTVCGPAPRWSYFWNIASGDERDLHPWFPAGFDRLVGPRLGKAITTSGSVDVSSCAEVGGGATPCLYGEVTAPKSFDRWFCGGVQGACKNRLALRPFDVNPAFAGGELCVAGPWVHERVHGGRPEIHPADVFWTRGADGDEWRIAFVPDHSGRFEKDKLYRSLVANDPAPSGWSKRRTVELWMAFEHDSGVAAAFDSAARCITGKNELTIPGMVTVPAAGGPFTAVKPPMPGMTMAARTWSRGPSTRGLLVLRADSRMAGCDAVVAALARRAARDTPVALPLEPVGAPAVAPMRMPATEPVPALRLRTVDEVSRRRGSLRGVEQFSVETRAGFAGGTPTAEDDQGVADALNASLRKSAEERKRVFGTDRPFTIQWDIEARRISDGAHVEVRVGVGPQPGDKHVTVRRFRSDLTRDVKVNPGESAARFALGKEGLKRAGDILVSVPHGVRVRGRGVVQFVGTMPPALVGSSAGIGFTSPTSADEWELLGEILGWIPGADAARRLAALQELACHPVRPPCSLRGLAKHAADGIRDPATRFTTLRELEDPQRTFARYVRHMAIGYLYNGSADSSEVQSLKDLLEAACLHPTDGTAPAAFCQ